MLLLFKHALISVGLNTFIALTLSAMDVRYLYVNMVFSQCIGLSIWVLIEAAQHWLITDWDHQWRRLVAIVPTGVVLGYLLGTLVADQLLQINSFGALIDHPRSFLGLLTMSMAAGALMTYFFLSRRQLAAEKQRAEVALRQAAESRLKLLEAQLEPHMLFNLSLIHISEPTRP